MKRSVLPRTDGVRCRVCGAQYAKMRKGSIGGVCDTCWWRFQRGSEGEKPAITAPAFNRYAARELFKSVNRMQKFGMSTRCEAISSANRLLRDGYQCRLWATATKNGHKVCSKHAKAHNPIFVEDVELFPYKVFEAALVRLMKTDKLFKRMVQRAADAFA